MKTTKKTLFIIMSSLMLIHSASMAQTAGSPVKYAFKKYVFGTGTLTNSSGGGGTVNNGGSSTSQPPSVSLANPSGPTPQNSPTVPPASFTGTFSSIADQVVPVPMYMKKDYEFNLVNDTKTASLNGQQQIITLTNNSDKTVSLGIIPPIRGLYVTNISTTENKVNRVYFDTSGCQNVAPGGQCQLKYTPHIDAGWLKYLSSVGVTIPDYQSYADAFGREYLAHLVSGSAFNLPPVELTAEYYSEYILNGSPVWGPKSLLKVKIAPYLTGGDGLIVPGDIPADPACTTNCPVVTVGTGRYPSYGAGYGAGAAIGMIGYDDEVTNGNSAGGTLSDPNPLFIDPNSVQIINKTPYPLKLTSLVAKNPFGFYLDSELISTLNHNAPDFMVPANSSNYYNFYFIRGGPLQGTGTAYRDFNAKYEYTDSQGTTHKGTLSWKRLFYDTNVDMAYPYVHPSAPPLLMEEDFL